MRLGRASDSFNRLEHETDELTQEPTGVGLDVPGWLQALESEVREARQGRGGDAPADSQAWQIEQHSLSAAEISEQLTGWEREPM